MNDTTAAPQPGSGRARLRLRDFVGRNDEGLAPGQRAVSDFPRFSDRPWRPLPVVPEPPTIRVDGACAHPFEIPISELDTIGRREVTADFNCVTTWCVRGLRWRGVPFVEFYSKIVVPRAVPDEHASWLRIFGLDGAAACVALEDALHEDVLLADALAGEPLSPTHGAPLRFVSPAQYAYKSVKHVARIEFCVAQPRPPAGAKEHPRARVELEERHMRLPPWLVRWPYRLVAPLTALIAERAAERTRSNRATPGG